jgi:NAD(P)-dependent dehydrogenase (short-subunit alcohol dehydrogenase family)
MGIMFEAIVANTIMVTAATSELGQTICDHLGQQGYDLVATGRNQDKLDKLISQLKNNYPEINVSSAIIDFEEPNTIVSSVAKLDNIQLKGIVLIGPKPDLGNSAMPSKEQWQNAFYTTFVTPLETIRLFAPQLENNSSIVIISGITSHSYIPSYPNHNVMRMAWRGEVKNLAHAYAERGIRSNVISPWLITTPSKEKNLVKKRKTKVYLMSNT